MKGRKCSILLSKGNDVTQCTSGYLPLVGVRRSRVVTFTAIIDCEIRGSVGAEIWKRKFLLHSHSSGGEGVSSVQGEVIRRRYIKPE